MARFVLYLIGMAVGMLIITVAWANPDWPDWAAVALVLGATALGLFFVWGFRKD